MKVNRAPKWMAMRKPRRTALFLPFLGALAVVCVALCLQIAARSKPSASAAHGSKASRNTSAYDPIVLPISEAALRQALLQNSGNAVAEYQWLLRAGYQHQEKNAYDTMSRLRREQPNNPVVLDGYFMALEMTRADIRTMNYNGGLNAPVIPYDHWVEDAALADLQRAYKLAPKLWLTYAIDGEDKFCDSFGSHSLVSREQGLKLLQKAESLAPEVPYTHWLLGYAYICRPVSKHKYELAAAECKQALASGARISDAAFILFQIYSLLTPNPAEEIKWKRKFLSLVPPDVKINSSAKALLDRYPG
jgi:hypothetical protein